MLCVISWSMFSRLIDKKTLCTDERKRQLELTSPATEVKSVYFPSENAFFFNLLSWRGASLSPGSAHSVSNRTADILKHNLGGERDHSTAPLSAGETLLALVLPSFKNRMDPVWSVSFKKPLALPVKTISVIIRELIRSQINQKIRSLYLLSLPY